jgi:hypothetical protein
MSSRSTMPGRERAGNAVARRACDAVKWYRAALR